MSLNVNQPNGISLTPVYNGCQVNEDPQCVRVLVDSDSNVDYNIDLSYLHNMQNFSAVQCVYIDNSANDSAFILRVTETQQEIKCAARKQGYFPILVPKKPKFIAKRIGTITTPTPIFLLNFTVAQGLW